MNTNLKSTDISKNCQTKRNHDSVEQTKTSTFHVQTGLSAGWVPGSNAREWVRGMRESAPTGFSAPEIR